MLRPELVLNLILSKHEINMRAEALGDEIFEAFVALGDRDAALGLLEAQGASLTAGKGYDLVDAFLEAGEAEEARKLFDGLEPIEVLLGSRPPEVRPDYNELEVWAERALFFREPRQINAALSELRRPDDPFGRGFDLDDYRMRLKILAVRGELMRKPDLIPQPLMEALEIQDRYNGLFLYFAARSAFQAGNDSLAVRRLEMALSLVDDLGSEARRRLRRYGASGRQTGSCFRLF